MNVRSRLFARCGRTTDAKNAGMVKVGFITQASSVQQ